MVVLSISYNVHSVCLCLCERLYAPDLLFNGSANLNKTLHEHRHTVDNLMVTKIYGIWFESPLNI